MRVLYLLILGTVLAAADEPPKVKGAFEQILDINQGLDTDESPHTPDLRKLFEGDVRLNGKQKLIKSGLVKPNGGKGPGQAATNDDKIKWPNAVIPYEFDCSVANMDRAIKATKEAMAEWEKRSCIRFKKRTTEKNYVWLHRGSGCWSEVGMVYGRKNYLSIGHGCEYKHVMIHELGHAIGFWHEQSRPDRDSYLTIHWANVRPGLENNFKKKLWGKEVVDYGVPYDYSSIMHYPWTAFSRNGKPTIEARRRLRGKTPYAKLSDDDVLQVNRMYKCPDSSARHKRSTRQKRAAKCEDMATQASCLSWKRAGFCERYSDLFHWCMKTCEYCSSDSCMDQKQECKGWRNAGFCLSDVQLMKKYCSHSCEFCNGGKQKCGCPTKPTSQPTQPPAPTTERSTQTPTTERSTLAPTTIRRRTEDPLTDKPTTRTTSSSKNPTTKLPTKRMSILSTIIPSTNPKTNPRTKPPSGNFAVGIRCYDQRDECPNWAKRGDCQTNGYVERVCRISCQTRCDLKEPRPEGSCGSPLGLGWDFKGLPDHAFSASSEYAPGSWVAAARNARLYFEDNHKDKRIGAWCAKERKDQWLQIDLGRRKKLTGIATQGRDVFHEHVKSYRLSFSNNGRDWREYKENGKVKTFTGNCDHFTPVLNRFNQVIARYVKIFVVNANYPCMRVELYGCI